MTFFLFCLIICLTAVLYNLVITIDSVDMIGSISTPIIHKGILYILLQNNTIIVDYYTTIKHRIINFFRSSMGDFFSGLC